MRKRRCTIRCKSRELLHWRPGRRHSSHLDLSAAAVYVDFHARDVFSDHTERGESDTSARGRIWRRRNRRGKLELRLLPDCCPHTIFEALRRCNLAAPDSVSARIQN